MENQLIINGIDNHVACCEAIGLSKCFEAYASKCANEYIFEIGFNPNNGYVYIALVNGIQICSMLGGDVEYIVIDFESGDEKFFGDYEEALSHSEEWTKI